MKLPRFTVDNVAFTAMVFAVVAIAVISTLSIVTADNLINASERVLTTQRIISSLEAIRFHAVSVDSGGQNFVITGDERALTPYREGGVEMMAEIESLSDRRKMVPLLDQQYDQLKAAIATLVVAQRAIVEARQRDGFAAARRLVSEGHDDVAQQQVIALAYQILTGARRKLDRMEAEQVQSQERVQRWIIALICASIIVLAFLYSVVRKLNRDQQLAREKMTFIAMHDSLTGLPNRAAMIEHLDARLADSDTERALGGFALMLLDLDGFKAVNDQMGHDAGDELLKLVAARMVGALRESDYLTRLGGDEFLIVIPQVSDRDTAKRVADKLIAVLGRPYTVQAGVANVTVSIGMSVFPTDGDGREALMKCADLAMYASKHAGRNQAHFYEASMAGTPR